MMTEAIIIALISGLCVAIPSVIATLSSNNKYSALTNYRIEELTKKVEKLATQEQRIIVLEGKVENLEGKVDNLEKRGE